jgi:hypothetical protein
MRVLLFLTLFSSFPVHATDAATLERDLDHIARVATVMIDGDVCKRIVTPRAVGYMLRTDPRDPWADGDNYDVDDKAFIQTKKTLMRLARLVDYPVDVNLWMPLPKNASEVQVVIRNRHEMSQFWVWGKLHQEMFPPMRTVLETGKRITVKQNPGYVSVLAPVRDSMGDIVGLVEAVSRVEFDARENVK